MSETLPFSELKAHLSEVADRVECEHDRILVTRDGRLSFVWLAPMTWRRWRRRSTSSKTTS
jgi:antitoxin YefM